MAITRTAMQDDDGSGLTGTILNNAWKQELYNQIDGMITYGTFTPIDVSGAALVFTGTVGQWAKQDRLVHVWMQLTYPATANAAPAYIGGLPYPVRVPVGGVQGLGIGVTFYLNPGNNAFHPLGMTTSAALTNAQMSGAGLIINASYLTD